MTARLLRCLQDVFAFPMSWGSYTVPTEAVLKLSSKTVIVLDQKAAALNRLWCLYQAGSRGRV